MSDQINVNDIASKLNLFDDTPVEVAGSLPEQRGNASFAPPQPGRHHLRLQDTFKAEDFESFRSKQGAERIRLKLRLRLVGKPGQFWYTQVTNAPYQYSNVWVTDWDYLVQALGVHLPAGSTNRDYISAILQHGGKDFFATSRWSAQCSNTKLIRNDEGKEVPGRMGCGRRFAEDNFTSKKTNQEYLAIPKDEATGLRAERFRCACGSVIRVFPNITAFEPGVKEDVPF